MAKSATQYLRGVDRGTAVALYLVSNTLNRKGRFYLGTVVKEPLDTLAERINTTIKTNKSKHNPYAENDGSEQETINADSD